MKLKKIILTVVTTIVLLNSSAFGGWEWQNPLPSGNSLTDIWGSSATDVFVVGANGTILHYDGKSPKKVPAVLLPAMEIMLAPSLTIPRNRLFCKTLSLEK